MQNHQLQNRNNSNPDPGNERHLRHFPKKIKHKSSYCNPACSDQECVDWWFHIGLILNFHLAVPQSEKDIIEIK